MTTEHSQNLQALLKVFDKGLLMTTCRLVLTGYNCKWSQILQVNTIETLNTKFCDSVAKTSIFHPCWFQYCWCFYFLGLTENIWTSSTSSHTLLSRSSPTRTNPQSAIPISQRRSKEGFVLGRTAEKKCVVLACTSPIGVCVVPSARRPSSSPTMFNCVTPSVSKQLCMCR